MITFGDKKIKEIFHGNTNIVKVYAEINLVFPDIIPYDEDYLTIEIVNPGSGQLVFSANDATLQSTEIYYSLNGGEWTKTTFANGKIENLTAGDKVRLKGTNNAYASSSSYYCTIGASGSTPHPSFNISGNIMSLIYGDTFKEHSEFPSGSSLNFCSLFRNSNAVSAENLILPAMTLTVNCYRSMFSDTTLEKAPQLPATNLAQSCYHYMFKNCLFTEAPELPATTLANGCYYGTFSGCTHLEIAPDLLAEVMVPECYRGMFEGCTSLNYIKCLAVSRDNSNATQTWMRNNAGSGGGTFVKSKDVTFTWSTGDSGIKSGWTVETV